MIGLASKENVMSCRKCGMKLLRCKRKCIGGYAIKSNTKSRLEVLHQPFVVKHMTRMLVEMKMVLFLMLAIRLLN